MIWLSAVKRRWFTPVVGAMVVGLALTLAGPASTATATSADPAPAATRSQEVGPNTLYLTMCFPVRVNGQIIQISCHRIPVALHFEPLCPPLCGPTLGWRNDPRVLPESIENMINEMIVRGLVRLGDAASTTDPVSRTRFRNEAMAAFTTAARYSMSTRLTLQQVGLANANNNTIDPKPEPWHSWFRAAGEDIADGMALLKQSLGTPPTAGDPWLRQAVAQFDEAYTELSQQRVIAG